MIMIAEVFKIQNAQDSSRKFIKDVEVKFSKGGALFQ